VTFQRHPDRHRGREILQVRTILSGYAECDTIAAVQKNSVAIRTMDIEEADTVVGANMANLYVPFEIIGCDPTLHKAQFEFGLESSKGMLIGAAISDVASRMPYTASQDVPGMVEEITDLLRDIILKNRKEVNRRNIARARRLAMNAFIDRYIRNRSLCTATLTQEFGVSRAALYRMFEEDGGVHSYISKRRLYHTFLSLRNGPLNRGAVKRVSEEYGFVDTATFSRAFKREFGFNASEVFDLKVSAGPDDKVPLNQDHILSALPGQDAIRPFRTGFW